MSLEITLTVPSIVTILTFFLVRFGILREKSVFIPYPGTLTEYIPYRYISLLDREPSVVPPFTRPLS